MTLVKRMPFESRRVQTLRRRGFLAGSISSLAALLGACEHTERQPSAPTPASSPGAKSKVPALEPKETTGNSNSAPATDAPAGSSQKEETQAAETSLPRVYLAPLGEHLPSEDVTYIQTALAAFYRIQIRELALGALPQEAYYPPRSRYRAEKLLDFLKAHAPKDSHVVVGLTAVDISTTKGNHEDWGILGLASVGGGECVVSRFRAKRGAKDDHHTRVRLAKTVVHEVGHTLGLLHCPNYGCLMEDGKGTVTTTDHEVDLCDACRSKLGPHVVPRDAAQIPWRV